jgi:hypothetical protein
VGDSGFDMIVLPGGMPGARNLRDDERVLELVRARPGAVNSRLPSARRRACSRLRVCSTSDRNELSGFLDPHDTCLPSVTRPSWSTVTS